MRTAFLTLAAFLAALALPPVAAAGQDAADPLVAYPVVTGEVQRLPVPVSTPDELARHPLTQLKSRSALVVRADNGEVLYHKNIDRDMPIASITKLMTAIVVLDAGQSLDDELRVGTEDIDRLRNTTSRLAVGARLTRRDLMILALMASENRAASALLRHYPGGKSAGVAAMNRKAQQLGMTHTRFVEGTGLSGDNRSSPVDLVRMVKAADSYREIREFSTTVQHTVQVGRRLQQFRNTNPLVKSSDWSINLTKTGFINEAGRCLVMQAKVAGMPVIFVLMDSVGKQTRVGDANRVRQWLESALNLSSLPQENRGA